MLDGLEGGAAQLRARHPRHARFVIASALAALCGLALTLADPRGVRQLRRLTADIERQRAANEALRREKTSLARTAKALESGNVKALEKAAREQLGFVHDDEVVFKFE